MQRYVVNNVKTHIKSLEDPAGITKIQNIYKKELDKRFKIIERSIESAIVELDVFGLEEEVIALQKVDLPYRAFKFDTDTKKVTAFIEWLNKLIDDNLLYLGIGKDIGEIDSFFGNVYVFEVYKKGCEDIRFDMRQQNVKDFKSIDAVLNMPYHIERVGNLFIRNYEALKGITTDMSKLIAHALSEGLLNGDSPRVIANTLLDVIEGSNTGNLAIKKKLGTFVSSKQRANFLARTETMRAHVNGAINECERFGYSEGELISEYIAGYDKRVCDKCSRLHMQKMSLEDIRNLLPMHPDCRCTFVPYFKRIRKPIS